VQSFLAGSNTGSGTPGVFALASGDGSGFTGGTCS
jgi:hypothetical protein